MNRKETERQVHFNHAFTPLTRLVKIHVPAHGKLKVQLTYRGLFYSVLPHCQKHAAQVADPHKVPPSGSPFRGLQRTHSNSWVGPTAKGQGQRWPGGATGRSRRAWRPCDLALPFTDGKAEARRGKSHPEPCSTHCLPQGMTPRPSLDPVPKMLRGSSMRAAQPPLVATPATGEGPWTRSFTLSFSGCERGQ